MKKLNSKGFGAVEILLVLIIVGIISGVGWYVWRARNSVNQTFSNTTNPTTKTTTAQSKSNKGGANNNVLIFGHVTFNHASYISTDVRNKIITRITDPFYYYYTSDLKLQFQGNIEIDVGKSQEGKIDTKNLGYILSYKMVGENVTAGGIFAQNSDIPYWIPQLCGGGGCDPFPNSIKVKYPANYQADLSCEAVQNKPKPSDNDIEILKSCVVF